MSNRNSVLIARRVFLKRAAIVAALPLLPSGILACVKSPVAAPAVAQGNGSGASAAAPANPSWKIDIASADEPGERMVISGTIYQPDGRTPAEGVTLYAYHTDARGFYTSDGRNRMPARLRGWMRTRADGKYEFHTIKPAPYPGRDFPAHIHATLSGAGYPEFWIDEYWFEGDPFITPEKLATLTGRGGGSSVLTLKRDASGVLRGVRDLKLARM